MLKKISFSLLILACIGFSVGTPTMVQAQLPAQDIESNNQSNLRAAAEWKTASADQRAQIEKITGKTAAEMQALANTLPQTNSGTTQAPPRSIAAPASAQTNTGTKAVYQPLTNIPGIDSSGTAGLISYINALITLTITLAAIFSVVQISLIGFTFISQDTGPAKRAEAKKQLFAVLTGVAIISSTYIILQAINPKLVDLSIFATLDTRFGGTYSDAQLDKLKKEDLGSVCYNTQASLGEKILGALGGPVGIISMELLSTLKATDELTRLSASVAPKCADGTLIYEKMNQTCGVNTVVITAFCQHK